MLGYGVTTVRAEDALRLSCPRCKYLLRKAQQDAESSERCCLSCVVKGCRYWADKAIDREVKQVQVICIDCDNWSGDLESYYEEHLPMCRQNKIDQLQKENDQLRSQISDQSQIPDEAVPLQNISDHFSSYSGPINGDILEPVIHPAKFITIKSDTLTSNGEIPSSLTRSQSDFSLGATASIGDESSAVDKSYDMAMEKAEVVMKQQQDNEKKIDEVDQKLHYQSRGLQLMRLSSDLLPKVYYRYTKQFYDYSTGIRRHNSTGMQCRWIIDDALSLVKRHTVSHPDNIPLIIKSPFWHTDAGGYRMQAFLYPNGLNDFLNTHVSVFVSVILGPNDASLSWPAYGEISVFITKYPRLLGKTILIEKKNAFRRPLHDSDGFPAAGWFDFISIDDLISNFIHEDDKTMSLEFSFVPRS